MISNINDIYKKVCEKHGMDYKLVKSVGDTVFSHLKEKILSVEEGSLFVSHMGSFVLKSAKVEKQLRRYLSMRAYKCKKYPDYINKPISKKAKTLFNIYLNVIIPFRKEKEEVAVKQREFAKKLYEEYNNSPAENDNRYSF